MKSDLQYFVNEKEKTVTCVATDCSEDAIKRCVRKVSRCKNAEAIKSLIYSWELSSIFDMADRYSGTAYCHEGDIFDEQLGKRIAKRKMLGNYWRARVKREKVIYEFFARAAEALKE